MNFFEIVLTLAISLGAVVWDTRSRVGFLLDGIQ